MELLLKFDGCMLVPEVSTVPDGVAAEGVEEVCSSAFIHTVEALCEFKHVSAAFEVAVRIRLR